jgi:hypothetical protein
MLSGGPISSVPISTSITLDYSGVELFIFNLNLSQSIQFVLKLKY